MLRETEKEKRSNEIQSFSRTRIHTLTKETNCVYDPSLRPVTGVCVVCTHYSVCIIINTYTCLNTARHIVLNITKGTHESSHIYFCNYSDLLQCVIFWLRTRSHEERKRSIDRSTNKTLNLVPSSYDHAINQGINRLVLFIEHLHFKLTIDPKIEIKSIDWYTFN